MAKKKRFRAKSPLPKESKVKKPELEPEIVEEIEPIEIGWEFHKVPLILSVVIAVVFYVLVFIFVK
ncbi:hypothetical protein KAU33_06000 [Candidatus Dependentiae bacterium]|nr:hypothetical protein [Candidatus Dependentiae bacterium]